MPNEISLMPVYRFRIKLVRYVSSFNKFLFSIVGKLNAESAAEIGHVNEP
jgi:hypothetical protein